MGKQGGGMVSSERPAGPDDQIGVRDALAQINRRIDDVYARIGDVNTRINDVNGRIDDANGRLADLRADLNMRIDDLRNDVNARFRLLMWGIAIGFGAVLAILGALLARVG